MGKGRLSRRAETAGVLGRLRASTSARSAPIVLVLFVLLVSTASRAQAELDTGGETPVPGETWVRSWLDPEDAFWIPRRGERLELAAYLGGEGSLNAFAFDRLPTLGGVNLNGALRYYPVDRLAVVLGTRAYLGLDGVPAPGTTAATVFSVTTGVRYDLVRENRFSLLWDLYSGPSFALFSDLDAAENDTLTAQAPTFSLGGEMGTALALRYSLGPWTGELRGLVGGRAGSRSAGAKGREKSDDTVGPFSSLYTGLDVGVTWSLAP
jgi:hypothetical protein